MFFEIDLAEKTAVRLHELVDLVRDLAFVESVAPFFADQTQRVSERRIFENVAFRGRAAFAVECVSLEKSAGQAFVKLRTEAPVERDQIRNWKPFLSVMNCRREIVRKFQLPEFFMQLGPRIDRSRNADRQKSTWRNHLLIDLVELGLHLVVAQAER